MTEGPTIRDRGLSNAYAVQINMQYLYFIAYSKPDVLGLITLPVADFTK